MNIQTAKKQSGVTIAMVTGLLLGQSVMANDVVLPDGYRRFPGGWHHGGRPLCQGCSTRPTELSLIHGAAQHG